MVKKLVIGIVRDNVCHHLSYSITVKWTHWPDLVHWGSICCLHYDQL